MVYSRHPVPRVLARTNDRIAGITFPITDTIARPCYADLRVTHVAEPDVEHVVPLPATEYLRGRYPLLLPSIFRKGTKNRIRGVLGPMQPVWACRVTDRIRFDQIGRA